jgi:hypothetical protein
VGTFYASLTVLGASAARVENECRERRRDASVVESGDAIVVDDARFLEDDGLEALGRALTSDDDVTALGAVVLDSDVLILQLFAGGEVVDTYISAPTALAAIRGELDDSEEDDAEIDQAPPTGGDAATYVRILGRGDQTALHAALHLPPPADPEDDPDDDWEGWVFAEDRHAAVIEALQLPDPGCLSPEEDRDAEDVLGRIFEPPAPGEPPPPDILEGGRAVEFETAIGLVTNEGDSEATAVAIVSDVRVFATGFALQLDIGARAALPPIGADVPVVDVWPMDGASPLTRVDTVDAIDVVHPEGHPVEVRIIWISPLPLPGADRIVLWVRRPGFEVGMIVLPADVLRH